MASDTRELFLDTAEELFADRGFYGVSIAAIADELGLTKQALLHHFGSKEKLYGEVLARISARIAASGDAINNQSTDPVIRLKAVFLHLHESGIEQTNQTRLLMRELLDNQQRADAAATWHLKPFLENLIKMVQDVPKWSDATDAEALALLYQWLGAINYFAVSGPTLSGIFGRQIFKHVSEAYSQQFENLIASSLDARQTSSGASMDRGRD